MGEAIAGAALSAFFDALFGKLASSELLNFATEAQVHGEIKEWKKMLRKLHLVLEDAEDKQIQNRLVKEWLRELKHLSYDVEDILDEFSTECLHRKVMGEPRAASTRKITKLIPACCTSFTPRTVMFNSDMMSKIREITKRLNAILQEIKDLNLEENVSRTSSKGSGRHFSTSLKDEPVVYGRDDDKDKILELLFRYETSDAKIGVIPIVGMGGMGKTTLAKLVYNDDSIPQHFQIKAWVCVSDVFDIVRVTKSILESVTSQTADLKELNELQLKLNKNLAGKRFLLVLDDVWTNNYDDWHVLRSPLMEGAPGSKIIVTTRSASVANMMGTVEYHDLKRVSNDDCWLLFSKHAFENRSVTAHPELVKVGREIVDKRCNGLPLAARTLGGLLRSKQRLKDWEEVLNNRLWSELDGSSNILPVLELSYHYLPSYLKRCFAYCAIFPQDYEFKRKEIVLLWMAEGLIPDRDDNKEMEDLGNDFFHDLLARSIFQASHTDRFIMHDLVNDLANKVAEDTCFRMGDEVNICKKSDKERARHSSYIRGQFDCMGKFSPFYNMKSLRTFLPLSLARLYPEYYLARSVPGELLKNLRFLRVLSLSRYKIRELPSSISDLKHLRYLDLSYSAIEVLPESLTSLYNLEILILKGSRKLKKLPSRIDNLVNLFHLDIRGADLIEGIPLGIEELKGLLALSNFIVGRGSFTITTLMSLKSLRGDICISKLNNVASASDARKAMLMDKEGINGLELKWDVDDYIQDGVAQNNVLDELRPHRNLEKLIITDYSGTRFPYWLGDPMFNNIVHLRLEGCKKCTSLARLGMLPSLQELLIIKLSSLQRIDQQFYGDGCSNPFPSLEVLCFEEMEGWEEWNTCDHGFRVLCELYIVNCDKLSGKLPTHLPSVGKLVIRDCQNLVVSLSSFAMLSALEIRSCKEVDFSHKVDLSSLNMVVLIKISIVSNLAEEFVQQLRKFKKLTVSSFYTTAPQKTVSSSRLRRFVFSREVVSALECVVEQCPQLMSMMVDEDKEQLQMELTGNELENLTLCGCEKLPAWIPKLMFLRELTIKACPIIFREVGLPSMLKVLRIRDCNVCDAFSDLFVCNRSPSLEELEIDSCDFLISFGKRQVPPTLKKLRIVHCKNLQNLLEENECESSSSLTNNLEDLYIFECDNLTSISFGRQLLSRLQSLEICGCRKLETIVERFDHNTSLGTICIIGCSSLKSLPDGLHNLVNLFDFRIEHCPCIVSFPQGGLPTPSLRELTIKYLEQLETLPDNMHKLSSLQHLSVSYCPRLVSFPSQGLPSNLTAFTIFDLEKLEPLPNNMYRLSSLQKFDISICPSLASSLSEWGLDQLNSLRELVIARVCPEVVSFPPDETGVMLPPSLTRLTIIDFPSLEYLSTRGFQNLTSLQYLYIRGCPKLVSFPENGLPDSLLQLVVHDCPIMNQRCLEGKGPEWSKILNIPDVCNDMMRETSEGQ